MTKATASAPSIDWSATPGTAAVGGEAVGTAVMSGVAAVVGTAVASGVAAVIGTAVVSGVAVVSVP